jgi:hypothetical protein
MCIFDVCRLRFDDRDIYITPYMCAFQPALNNHVASEEADRKRKTDVLLLSCRRETGSKWAGAARDLL